HERRAIPRHGTVGAVRRDEAASARQVLNDETWRAWQMATHVASDYLGVEARAAPSGRANSDGDLLAGVETLNGALPRRISSQTERKDCNARHQPKTGKFHEARA